MPIFAANDTSPGLAISDVVWIHVTTVGTFAVCVCFGIWALRNNHDLLKSMVSNTSWILRIATVLFVIWATTALATIDRLDEGVTAIFGAIVGYVFGTIHPPRGNQTEDSADGKPPIPPRLPER